MAVYKEVPTVYLQVDRPFTNRAAATVYVQVEMLNIIQKIQTVYRKLLAVCVNHANTSSRTDN